MKYKGQNKLVFTTTGREVYAYGGIVGIDSDLDAYEGYDDYLTGPMGGGKLRRVEQIELADAMIDRWMRFKEARIAEQAAGVPEEEGSEDV